MQASCRSFRTAGTLFCGRPANLPARRGCLPEHVPVFPTMKLRLFCLGLVAALAPALGSAADLAPPTFRLSTFSADVTVPIGHGMMGGAWLSKSVADPLTARGFVLKDEAGKAPPVVFVAVDWC